MNSLEVWAKGLLAAIVAGAATSVSSIVADAAVFNAATPAGWKHIGVSAISGAVVGLVMYLKQSPVPNSQSKA